MLYNFKLSSAEGRLLVVGNRSDKNPLTETRKKRLLPFHKMLVGDSLFFTREEMPKGDIDRAIACMNQINYFHAVNGEHMFKVIRGKIKVEIVRIR